MYRIIFCLRQTRSNVHHRDFVVSSFSFIYIFLYFRRLHTREIKWSTELNLAFIMLASLTTHISKTDNKHATRSYRQQWSLRRSHTNSSDLGDDATITQRQRLGGSDGTWKTWRRCESLVLSADDLGVRYMAKDQHVQLWKHQRQRRTWEWRGEGDVDKRYQVRRVSQSHCCRSLSRPVQTTEQ